MAQEKADEMAWEAMSETVKVKKLVSPLQFLKAGMALEHERVAIQNALAGQHALSTSRKQVSLQSQITGYEQRYTTWLRALEHHIPGIHVDFSLDRPEVREVDEVDEVDDTVLLQPFLCLLICHWRTGESIALRVCADKKYG